MILRHDSRSPRFAVSLTEEAIRTNAFANAIDDYTFTSPDGRVIRGRFSVTGYTRREDGFSANFETAH